MQSDGIVSRMTAQFKQAILFGHTEISYGINFCQRKTLAIHVYPDGQVMVDAPMTASNDIIAEKVKKRAAWIFKQQRQFASYPPALPKRQYVSGETYRYLGRQYRLSVIHSEKEQVKLKWGRLVIETNAPHDSDYVKKLLQDWYRSRATVIFTERYNFCVQQVARLNIEHHQGVQIRLMSKRWGSCTSKGNIFLNPELVAAPKDCIDYVIVHELCHLKEHNHSSAFYKLLTAIMKDWQSRRKQLNELVEVRFY